MQTDIVRLPGTPSKPLLMTCALIGHAPYPSLNSGMVGTTLVIAGKVVFSGYSSACEDLSLSAPAALNGLQ